MRRRLVKLVTGRARLLEQSVNSWAELCRLVAMTLQDLCILMNCALALVTSLAIIRDHRSIVHVRVVLQHENQGDGNGWKNQ